MRLMAAALFASFSAGWACAATATPQLLLGVPQPVVGKSFTAFVLVEAAADVTPLATGTITINWGDNTTPTVSTLSNSLVTAQHSYSNTGAYTITASYGGDSNYSQATTSQIAIALSSSPAAVTLNTFGDSITYGIGATAPAYAYADVVAATEGWTLKNYGVPGDDSIDTCEIINAVSPLPATAYNTLFTGENDLRYAMTSNAGEAEYISAVTACSVWLARVQGSSRTIAASSANTRTGSWTASTLYTNTGLNSTQAGSTITGSFTGNVFYAQLTSTQTNDYTVGISIDGGAVANYTPPVLNYPGTRVDYGPYAIRIPLAGANTTAHTVRFSCISPGTGGCYVDWFAGNGLGSASPAPYLWLATPYYTGQPGYAQSEYTQMAQFVRNIQAQLFADGLPVYLADLANWFQGPTNPQCMYDETHPSNCGHAILAATFIGAMDFLLADVPQVHLSTAGTHNFGYVAAGLTEKYGVQITNATTASQPMNIQLSGAPQFSEQTSCGTSLSAGKNCEVVFTYAPVSQELGLQSANWSLTGLATGVVPQNGGTLLANAEPSAALTLNTIKHNFGSVAIGAKSSAFGLIIANPNSSAFTGTLTISGATSQYVLQNYCTLPIAAFGNCEVLATFAPTSAGTQNVTVTITPTVGETITPGNVVTFTGTAP